MSKDKTEGTKEERSAFDDAVQTRYKDIGNVLWQNDDTCGPGGSKELWKILTGLAAITRAMMSTLNLLGEVGLISKEDASVLCMQHVAVVENTQASLKAAAIAADDASE